MASSSGNRPRPGGAAQRRGGGSGGQSAAASRPGRYLIALAVLLLLLLAGVLGGAIVSPGGWQSRFVVHLGLDLSSGTTVTLKAVSPNGKVPNATDMNTAVSILTSRVNGQGFTGASVQKQGTDLIVVTVPGKSAQQVNPLLSTAQLRFRQVLLENLGVPAPVATPTPTASASASASPTASGNASSSASASASGSASPSGSAKPSSSASASPSPSASAKSQLPTSSTALGNPSLVNPAVLPLFDKLNCADKNWQAKIYGTNSNQWDNPNKQIVACDDQGYKYVLDVAKVTGQMLSGVSAGVDPTYNRWVVNFTLKPDGTTAFGKLSSSMFTQYGSSLNSPGTNGYTLDKFAIVLDGKVVTAPTVNGAMTTGSGQIYGSFTSASANNLAADLRYGSLPLSFNSQSTASVSPQLGSQQLNAGLIAAAIGLLLVVIYSFLYYRGLGIVSVFSLVCSALLTWLSVILLSTYEGFTLSLAGVAGLIVAIGITADSFVVYFERLRDEVREGRSLRAAVERGWTRARRTILVSDTVSFLAAALLYILAIGDVKGFAFTLGLTTVIDVVVVFLFTKPMITLLARTRFYGQGHKLSGLDPARLGAKSPWRGSKPAASTTAVSQPAGKLDPKEA